MIFFSHHAMKQMQERGIERAEVEAALRDYAYSYKRPDPHPTSPPTRVYVGMNDVTVVFEEPHHGYEGKVLTAARKDRLLGDDNVRPFRSRNQ